MSDRTFKFSKWDDFVLPPLTKSDYGLPWPPGTVQVSKELACFKMCRMGHRGGEMLSCFHHYLNIVRILFPDSIDIYKDVVKSKIYNTTGRIWNNYFLDITFKLCSNERQTKKKHVLTGPASANKTHAVALFGFICFLAAPNETMVLVSTTSGVASERKIWGDMKEMHRNCKFKEAGLPVTGEPIDYKSMIVFDEGKQLYDAKLNDRDTRNGISVVAIPTDGTGENALSTIQGSKNTFVIWILDEMAQMKSGVTRPLRNLIPGNPHVHFIGIGNANEPTDPHGEACMPKGGFESLNYLHDREWRSAQGYDVLYLSGDESPNYHPYVNQDAIEISTEYPFPYATNKQGVDMVAEDAGNGDLERGRGTIDYWKFCIGWWAPTTATSSLYTENLFVETQSTEPPEIFLGDTRTFGAGDFAFTVGGDDNGFIAVESGRTHRGIKQVKFPGDVKSLKTQASNKADFNKAVAAEFAAQIIANKVAYQDFGGDTGNDAAITLNEISRILKTHDLVGISSNNAANNKDKYANRVTEMWFDARDLLRTGIFRGINLQSMMVKQLCQRKYKSVRKGYYQIETKKDMKKRLGRSPDMADTFIYVCEMLKRSGLFDSEIEAARTIKDAQEEREEIEAQKRAPDEFRQLMGAPVEDEYYDTFDGGNDFAEYEEIF